MLNKKNNCAILLIINVLLCNATWANVCLDNLSKQMHIKNSLVCVGLDPDPRKFPNEIQNMKNISVEELVQEANQWAWL